MTLILTDIYENTNPLLLHLCTMSSSNQAYNTPRPVIVGTNEAFNFTDFALSYNFRITRIVLLEDDYDGISPPFSYLLEFFNVSDFSGDVTITGVGGKKTICADVSIKYAKGDVLRALCTKLFDNNDLEEVQIEIYGFILANEA